MLGGPWINFKRLNATHARTHKHDSGGNGGGGSVTDHGLARRLAPDQKNLDILVWVGDRLLPREMAKVSVFDSTVQVRGKGCVCEECVAE